MNQTKEFNDRQIAGYAAMVALAQTRDNDPGDASQAAETRTKCNVT